VLVSRLIARSFGIVLSAATVAFALVPPPAVAGGDCPGMIDFTYVDGVCHDKTGETFDTMRQMYRDDYQNQQGMIDRSRSLSKNGFGMSAGSAPRVREPSPELKRAMALSLVTRQMHPSDEVDGFVARLHVRDASDRRRVKAQLLQDVSDFDQFGPKHGYSREYILGARMFFLETAYYAYSGEAIDGARGAASLSGQLVLPTARWTLGLSDLNRRRAYDSYLLQAVLLRYWNIYAGHDARRRAVVRRNARYMIVSDLGVDPAQVSMRRLPCNNSPLLSFMSCEKIIQFKASLI